MHEQAVDRYMKREKMEGGRETEREGERDREREREREKKKNFSLLTLPFSQTPTQSTVLIVPVFSCP